MAAKKLTKEQRKSMELWNATALIYGYNELAKIAPTLGEKVYLRLMVKQAEELLKKHGGDIDIAEGQDPVLVLNRTMPYVNFYERDIEQMRACVAAYDDKKPPPPLMRNDPRFNDIAKDIVRTNEARTLNWLALGDATVTLDKQPTAELAKAQWADAHWIMMQALAKGASIGETSTSPPKVVAKKPVFESIGHSIAWHNAQIAKYKKCSYAGCANPYEKQEK